MKPQTDWQTHLAAARKSIASYADHLAALIEMRDAATAEVLALGRGAGVEMNPDAVQASIAKPYALLRTDDPNTWKVITWRGRRDMPVIGWIDWQDDAFIVSTINRATRFVSDVPDWMLDTIGWQPPEFAAALNPGKTLVQLSRGDRSAFQRRYGAWLAGSADSGFRIKKGRAWIELLEKMLNDGIVPFTATPVSPEHWDAHAPCKVVLRDYQQPYVEQFLRDGAESIILPSGAGKTMIALYLIAHLVGHETILCDSDVLVGQWKARLKEYTPHADVEVLSFQAAMRRLDDLHGVFLLIDEGHRLPADTWSRLAFTRFQYRGLMTATPWRLKRQAMVFALGGPPRVIPWKELIDAGVLNRPRVQVIIVPNPAFKLPWIKKALAEHRDANALIYSDSIQYGKELADALDLPFIHGETKDKYARVMEARQRIVSKAIEASVDIPDLTLVIEADVSRTGESRISEGQRIGRLLHGRQCGEYFILLTPDDFSRFRGRLLGVEAELGDIVEYVDLTGQGIQSLKIPERKSRPRPRPPIAQVKPGDEVGAILAAPAIRRLILDHEKNLGATRQGYMAKAFRILWKSDGTSEELRLREGKAAKTWEWYQAALNMLVKAGLAKKVNDRYYLDRARINALKR